MAYEFASPQTAVFFIGVAGFSFFHLNLRNTVHGKWHYDGIKSSIESGNMPRLIRSDSRRFHKLLQMCSEDAGRLNEYNEDVEALEYFRSN